MNENFFSSHEPNAPGELIDRQAPSFVHPSTISNDFSSETTGPIATKLHIQPSDTLGKKKLFKWSGSHDQHGRHAHIW